MRPGARAASASASAWPIVGWLVVVAVLIAVTALVASGRGARGLAVGRHASVEASGEASSLLTLVNQARAEQRARPARLRLGPVRGRRRACRDHGPLRCALAHPRPRRSGLLLDLDRRERRVRRVGPVPARRADELRAHRANILNRRCRRRRDRGRQRRRDPVGRPGVPGPVGRRPRRRRQLRVARAVIAAASRAGGPTPSSTSAPASTSIPATASPSSRRRAAAEAHGSSCGRASARAPGDGLRADRRKHGPLDPVARSGALHTTRSTRSTR